MTRSTSLTSAKIAFVLGLGAAGCAGIEKDPAYKRMSEMVERLTADSYGRPVTGAVGVYSGGFVRRLAESQATVAQLSSELAYVSSKVATINSNPSMPAVGLEDVRYADADTYAMLARRQIAAEERLNAHDEKFTGLDTRITQTYDKITGEWRDGLANVVSETNTRITRVDTDRKSYVDTEMEKLRVKAQGYTDERAIAALTSANNYTDTRETILRKEIAIVGSDVETRLRAEIAGIRSGISAVSSQAAMQPITTQTQQQNSHASEPSPNPSTVEPDTATVLRPRNTAPIVPREPTISDNIKRDHLNEWRSYRDATEYIKRAYEGDAQRRRLEALRRRHPLLFPE